MGRHRNKKRYTPSVPAPAPDASVVERVQTATSTLPDTVQEIAPEVVTRETWLEKRLRLEQEAEERAWVAYRDTRPGALGDSRARKAAGRRVRKDSFLAGYRAAKAASQ